MVALSLLLATVAQATSFRDPTYWQAPLPSPAPISADSVDDAAEMLARKVGQGSPAAMPYLLAALRASGFAVVDGETGEIIVAPENERESSGASFEDIEVRLMLAAGDGVRLPLDSLTGSVAEAVEAPAAQVGSAMQEDFNIALDNGPRFERFWAHFVNSLSALSDKAPLAAAGGVSQLGGPPRQLGGDSADLSRQLQEAIRSGDPDRIQRLQKQMQEQLNAISQGRHTQKSATPASARLSLIQAAMMLRMMQGTMAGASLRAFDGAGSAFHGPFAFEDFIDPTGSIFSRAAARGNEIYTRVTDLVAPGTRGGNLIAAGKNIAKAASAIGSFGKLLLAWAEIKVNFDPSNNRLTRSHRRETGQPKQITATVSWENHSTAMAQPCIHIDLKKIPLPNTGLVKGAFCKWLMEHKDSAPNGNSLQYIQRAGEKLVGTTDQQGKARISIQTTPQPVDLPETVAPNERKVELIFYSSVEGNDLLHDTIEAVGSVLELKDGLFGPVKATLLKMNAKIRKEVGRETVIVKDWMAAKWGGTFRLTATGSGQGKGANWTINRSFSGHLEKLVGLGNPTPTWMTEPSGVYKPVLDSCSIRDTASAVFEGKECAVQGEATSAKRRFGPVSFISGAEQDAFFSGAGGGTATGYNAMARDLAGGTITFEVAPSGRGTARFNVDAEVQTRVQETNTGSPPRRYFEMARVNLPGEKQGLQMMSSKMNGSYEQEIDYEEFGAKGKVKLTLTFELHPEK